MKMRNLVVWLGAVLVAMTTCVDGCETCGDTSITCECFANPFAPEGPTKRMECRNQIPNFEEMCHEGSLEAIYLGGALYNSEYSESDIESCVADDKVPFSNGVIPKDAFKGLNITDKDDLSLFLDCSGITDIQDGAFTAVYDKLHLLRLAYNKLTHIPNELSRIRRLKNLHLEGNKLTSIGNVPPQITSLNVNDNPISGDLANHVDVLVKIKGLDTLVWPKSTMHCTCDVLMLYSADERPDYSLEARYQVENGVFRSIICDPDSAKAFVGSKVPDIEVGDVWKECSSASTMIAVNWNLSAILIVYYYYAELN